MNWFLLTIVVGNLLSISFLIITIKRVKSYLRKMVLPESQYTLLFKMFSMKFALYGYVAAIVIHALITLYLALY